MTLGETRDDGADQDPAGGSTNGQVAVADEDVLAGPVPVGPVRGPRRGFNRRRDWLVLAVIAVIALVAPFVVWRTSEFAATGWHPTTQAFQVLAAPEVFPPSLGEAWRVSSDKTVWQPQVLNPAPGDTDGSASTVVTGDGGDVVGRDPQTGDVRWSYHRDLDLCGVTVAWKRAVAVYRTGGGALPASDPMSGGGCSEVTSLLAGNGSREYIRDNMRNWDAEVGARFLYDDADYLTATGSKLLLTVRSDLVKTNEFGAVPAIVNPGKQPRVGCTYHSTTVTASKIAVIERCPDETTDRLTVLRSSPTDSDKPEEVTTQLLDGTGAQVVAMGNGLVAVALRDPDRLIVFNEQGQRTGNFNIDLGQDDLRADPPGGAPLTANGPNEFYWYTGSRTIGLDATDLHPIWTIPDTMGPGVAFAGRVLVPNKDGLLVLDQATGAKVGNIPVFRQGFNGTITMATVGPVVLEQRGTTLVALH